MKVITLEKTKELLGITDTSQDTQITAKIPIIDSKVKQITNNRYNYMIIGDITVGSPYVTVSSVYSNNMKCDYYYRNGYYGYRRDGINNHCTYDSIEEYLEVGQLISGTGIPADSYIDEVYYNGDVFDDGIDTFSVPTIKLSANATATTGSVRIYLGINIGYQDIIAKGIKFLIDGTSSILPTSGISSKSIGPVSVSYSSASQKLDNKYGMPAWFVSGLPKYASGH